MELNFIRGEIEHMRRQILRQRKEIRDLQRAGIATKSADELLERMLAKVEGLCAERDRLVGGAAPKVSRDKQSHQQTDRAPLPLNTYRRILRAAEQNFPYWVALQEENCVGAHYDKLREFCRERELLPGISLDLSH